MSTGLPRHVRETDLDNVTSANSDFLHSQTSGITEHVGRASNTTRKRRLGTKKGGARQAHFGADDVRVTVREAESSMSPEDSRKQIVEEFQTVWSDIQGVRRSCSRAPNHGVD